jgi:hypothetical protein
MCTNWCPKWTICWDLPKIQLQFHFTTNIHENGEMGGHMWFLNMPQWQFWGINSWCMNFKIYNLLSNIHGIENVRACDRMARMNQQPPMHQLVVLFTRWVTFFHSVSDGVHLKPFLFAIDHCTFFFGSWSFFPRPNLTHSYLAHSFTLIGIATTLVPYLLSPIDTATLITSYPIGLVIVLTTYPTNLATLLITYPTNLTTILTT